MTTTNAADEASLVPPNRVRDLVAGMIRGAQLDGWTYDTLGAATRLEPRRLKGWCVEGKEPPLSAALSLMLVLGKSKGVNPVLALIGYCGEPLDECAGKKAGQVVADLVKEVSVIAGAAANGRFDHTTQPMVQAAADLIIEEVVPLSSVGRAS